LFAYNFLSWDPDETTTQEAQQELIRRGFWNLPNLTAAFQALSRDGALERDPADPRPLSEHQRRSIALQASTGDIDGAISRYLHQRLPEPVANHLVEAFGQEDVFDQLADPQWKKIVEEAVWYCWSYGRSNYSPTNERKQFMQTYIAGRIPTGPLLDQAWKACQEAEKDVMRSAVLQQVGEPGQDSAPDLDRLSDEEVESLYHRTLWHVADPAHAA
jgi:hypothetical protein